MPPRRMKLRATAVVTGMLAAHTAIGMLDASMLDMATTSSMMNSMNVVLLSSPPTRWMMFIIQAMPKNRSSTMKRTRHPRSDGAPAISARNLRHTVMMMAWTVMTEAVQMLAWSGLVHRPDRTPMVATRMRTASEADTRFWANRRRSS